MPRVSQVIVTSTSKLFDTSPGVSLDALLRTLPDKQVRSLAGEQLVLVLRLVEAELGDEREAQIKVILASAEQKGSAAIHNALLRKTLIENLPIEKARELAERLEVPINKNIFSGLLSIDLKKSPEAAITIGGFFGLVDLPRAPRAIPESVDEITPQFGLFEHQRVAAENVLTSVSSPPGRVILHMPTGAGKTRTAMHVVCRLLNAERPRLVVWVAQSAELLDQAADAFAIAWHHLGNRPILLSRFFGSARVDELEQVNDGFLVAGLAKLHSINRRNPSAIMDLGSRSSLVIIDEAHQAIAPTYRVLLDRLADAGVEAALLGLTATPGRTWRDIAADEELSTFFNHNKVILEVKGYDNPVEYLMSKGYLARPTFSTLSAKEIEFDQRSLSSLASDEDFSTEILAAVGENIERNAAVVNRIRDVISRHTRIILFASSVQNAELLMSLLTAMGIEAYVITAETPLGQREHAIRRYKSATPKPMVICNFGVLTTGFDAPKTSAAIIARPTKSLVLYSQMMGRATRGTRAGGNKDCEIITVVDPGLPGFGDIAEAFVNWEDVWNS